MNNIFITHLSHDGRGIAKIDGKTTFVRGALAGETVDIEILKSHARYNDAKAVHILSESIHRATPQCLHFGLCGGCQLQHLSLDQQIILKQKNIFDQLKHIGKIPENYLTPDKILPPLVNPHPWGYRQKGRLSIQYDAKTKKLRLGFHEQSNMNMNGNIKTSDKITDLSQCEILNSKIGLKLKEIKNLLLALSIYQKIPHIEIACDERKCALIFKILLNKSDITPNDIQLLQQFGKKRQFQIYLQPNLPARTFLIFPENSNSDFNSEPSSSFRTDFSGLADHDFLSYQINRLQFEFLPSDFTQINFAMNPQMVNLAVKLLDLNSQDRVLDLFCGLGNFSLPIAEHCQHVTGIEGNPELVKQAEKNAANNKIHHVKFYTANLFKLSPPVSQTFQTSNKNNKNNKNPKIFAPESRESWINQKYTKILFDPPRAGAKEILPWIKAWQPERIVYVSCDPATFARDAGEIVNQYHYRLSKIGIIDMFPHTKHVESIALFTAL